MRRPNLRVLTHAHATDLIWKASVPSACAISRADAAARPSEVRARREVILSAGTYNSPQLLQLSGIGPAALLKSLGIPVQHALAGVGENLRDHYAPRFVARVKNIETINERVRGLRLAGEVAKYLLTRKGVLSLSPDASSTASGAPSRPWRTPTCSSPSRRRATGGRAGRARARARHDGRLLAAAPESKGYVRLRSADPFEAPIIQPNYLALEIATAASLLAGMRLARRLLKSRPLLPYYEREDFPGPGVETDDELLGAAKRAGHHHLPSLRHLPHGAGQRSDCRGRRPAQRARAGGAARHRRLDHADHALRQSQRRRP